jgi:DNA repair photolyase
VLPRITDSLQDLESVVHAAAAAGAKSVAAIPLFLKPCSAKIFIPFLQEHFPDLVSFYKERYAARAFLPVDYQRRISTLVNKLCRRHGIGIRNRESGARTSRGSNLSKQLNLFAP